MSHDVTICPRDVARTMYVGKGYKSAFECPACGRSTYQALNFLGRRNVVCNGVKFTKEAK